MNCLFIYVHAAFTTEFQLQLSTRSCFLALYKISNLNRNMISIFCLAFLQVFPRWLSWSSLSWSLRLQSRFLEERSWRKHTQDISALLSGTSSVAWEQYLFSSCQHCLRLCDFLHYRSCAKKICFLSLDPELASDHLSLINVSFPFGSALCPFRSSADRADRVNRADWADRDRDQAFKKVLKNETITEFLNYWITEPNPLFKPGVRMSLGTSPADPWKWMWSNCVGKSEISRIWCMSTTNKVKSCKKFNKTAQTANFTDLSLISCGNGP